MNNVINYVSGNSTIFQNKIGELEFENHHQAFIAKCFCNDIIDNGKSDYYNSLTTASKKILGIE